MKIVKPGLAALAAASFTLAQPVAAASSVDRLGASTEEAEGAAGGLGPVFGVLLAFVGLLAIGEITGALDVFGDDEEPASP